MTTSLQTDPRRASRDFSRKPLRPPLEMPVLFQLADLSLSQAKVTPPSPPAPAPTPQDIAPLAAIADPLLKEDAIARETPRLELSSVEAPPAEVAQVEPLPAPTAAAAVVEETKTAPTIVAVASVEAPAVESTAESVLDIATAAAASETETAPPQEPTAPTPRERAEQRAKNRQSIPASNDWMRTHGKFIAVGFIVALIATIYLAKNSDEPPPADSDSAVSAKAEPEAKEPLPTSEAGAKITDAYTAKESIPAQGGGRSPALLKEANPAEEQSPAEAHAELHSPTTDDSVKNPAEPSEVAESKSLFPWKESDESRVASKPDDGRSKVQLNPHVTERQPESDAALPANEPADEVPSAYGPPGNQPQAPAAEQPVNAEQQLSAQNNYPVTNPSSVGQYQPQNRPAPNPPRASSPRATPASYQPSTSNNVPPTRTSGPRNERTGSGLY